MSKVGGRGQMHLLSGVAYSHHINRLMNYVAVSCGACDHDTMTRLKSEELIQATLHFGYKAQSPVRFFLSLFFFFWWRGGPELGLNQEVGSCIASIGCCSGSFSSRLRSSTTPACELFTCSTHGAANNFWKIHQICRSFVITLMERRAPLGHLSPFYAPIF